MRDKYTKTKYIKGHSTKKPFTYILAAILGLVLIFGLGFVGVKVLKTIGVLGAEDYKGTVFEGTEEIIVSSGDTATAIAEKLIAKDIIKSYKAFIDAYNAYENEPVFQVGVYYINKKISAKEAIEYLLNENNIIYIEIVIPEGYRQDQIIELISDKMGYSLKKVQKAFDDVDKYNIPQKAKDNKSLEGFLFPATYKFSPVDSIETIIEKMVSRANYSLDSLGVFDEEDRYNLVVLASIVQTEAGLESLMGKVARVFLNRLGNNMVLGSDATVTYGTGRFGDVFPTQAELDDTGNLYNTRVNLGLPIGPISNPGDSALNAVISPESGNWLYFVTVNLQTGETIFSDTYEEHLAAVEQLNAWLDENPEYK